MAFQRICELYGRLIDPLMFLANYVVHLDCLKPLIGHLDAHSFKTNSNEKPIDYLLFRHFQKSGFRFSKKARTPS
jgi:hypothetical protein